MQFSVGLRNARGNQIETHIGAAPTLQIRSGAKPATCAAADSGTLLCSMTLPADWMAAFSSGSGSKSGTWSGLGVAVGTAGHFRIKRAGSPDTCEIQGTITTGSPTGDMDIDNPSIANGQTVTVTLFSVTEGNA